MTFTEKDLDHISGIIEDLNKCGFVRGGMAETMLVDWQKELKKKLETDRIHCNECGFVLGSPSCTKPTNGDLSCCEECQTS